ncbi:hypothetical protein ACFL6S_21385 [Candidatus Poribacteria bacterium]
MRRYIPVLFFFLLIAALLEPEAPASILSDPDVPDGEQIVWRASKEGTEPAFSTITWNVKSRDGRLVYEISTDSGERKQAKHIIGKSDLRLISARVLRDNYRGNSEATIEVKKGHQHLTYSLNDKRGEKKIEHRADSYNGMILPFSLRGFPFGKEKKVKLRLTPPFRPWMPLWAWKMWKSHVKVKRVEKVTVPAGTFDCYKLEVSASSTLIRQFTTKYYFWFTKKPPHQFVKYQDKDGDSVTELMEIRSVGRE